MQFENRVTRFKEINGSDSEINEAERWRPAIVVTYEGRVYMGGKGCSQPGGSGDRTLA